MISTTRYFLLLLLLNVAAVSFSQTLAVSDSVKELKPEFRRLINHEAIDKEQKNIMNSDGKADNLFTVSANDEINFFVTSSLINKVDWVQYKIEKDTVHIW